MNGRRHPNSTIALKVRRPGIRKTVEADLRLLAWLADLVEERAEELRQFHPRLIVEEFSRSLRRELDLAEECRNAKRIGRSFADNSHIRVPKVYMHWACERLNVQEFIDGIPGRDLNAADAEGLDRRP